MQIIPHHQYTSIQRPPWFSWRSPKFAAAGRRVRCRRGAGLAWATNVGHGHPVFSSPCFATVACEGCARSCPLVFVCSVPGLVAALRLSDGVIVGERHLPGEVFSSPVVAGRHLVVGCRDDNVYVLEIFAKCFRCVEAVEP